MKVRKPGRFDRLTRAGLSALSIALFAAPVSGCDATASARRNLRNDLAAIRAAHADSDAIGSLDPTAPPANLDAYRRGNGPANRTGAANR